MKGLMIQGARKPLKLNVRSCAWGVGLFLGREGQTLLVALSQVCGSAIPLPKCFSLQKAKGAEP